MIDHLSPLAAPQGIKVKRLNRIPAVLVSILALLVLGTFTYIIVESGHRNGKSIKEKEDVPFSLSTKEADSLLMGKPEYGVIEEPATSIPESSPGASALEGKASEHNSSAITPATTQPKAELSALEQEIERINLAKLKSMELAVSAPSSVSSGMGGLGEITKSEDLSSLQNSLSQAVNSGNNPMNIAENLKHLISTTGSENSDPNMQQNKNDFFNKEQAAAAYLPYTRTQQLSPLEIKTGTIIPAIMLTGINSDLPGIILAQVSQNVYDTATGSHLLIPQGSRLVGTYDNFIAYGQDRALVAWTRMVYPDGSTLELQGMPGTDQSGYAGLEDQVDNHYFRIFGSALLMSVITGVYENSQDDGSSSYYGHESASDSIAKAVAQEMHQATTALLRKNLNIQPTIIIRPGYRLNVMVNKDIIFPTVW